MPSTGWWIVWWRCSRVCVFLGQVGRLQGILGKVNGSTGLEQELEFGFTREVAILLSTNLATDKIRPKDRLLDFDLYFDNKIRLNIIYTKAIELILHIHQTNKQTGS